VIALSALVAMPAANAVGAISIGNVVIAEDTPVVTFPVSLSAPLPIDVSVNYDTSPTTGNATVGVDYDATLGTALIAAGETATTIDVPLNSDAIFEGSETFGLTLSSPVGDVFPGGAATAQGIATITDLVDRPVITITAGVPSIAEGDSASYTITRNGQTLRTASVTIVTTNGTATAGTDYTGAVPTTVSLPPGGASRTAIVTATTIDEAIGAEVFEGDETFTVALGAAPVDSVLGIARSVTTTITDDADTPTLTIANITVTEGGIATLNVTRTGATTQPATVAFATADGTATIARGDYVATSGSLTFAAGTSPLTLPIRVTTLNDTVNEPVPRMVANLATPVNVSLAQVQGAVSITDNDPTTLAINDVSVVEGDAGTVAATFAVSLSVPSEGAIALNRTTADGIPVGNAVAPADYTALPLASVPIRFAALDVTPKPVTVTINGDPFDEIDETFRVLLSGITLTATGVVATDALGIGTIVDNDPSPAISVREVILPEGNAGGTTATMTATLSAPSGRTVTASYTTGVSGLGADATAGVDYVATTGTLTYAPGETAKTFPVTINGDTAPEGSETVGILFSNLDGAVLPPPPGDVGFIVIADDDQFPISPFANDDALTTLRDTAATVNVLANDVDANGDFIFLSANGNPEHGTVSCTARGVCTYTPSSGYLGPDAFTYTVADGTTSAPDVGTVKVTVTRLNTAPVAGPDAAATVRGLPITVQVLGNDKDSDNDKLAVSAPSKPANGTVTCAADGACRYTPNAKFLRGTDSFTYTVSDGIATATGTVTVTVRARRALVLSATAGARRSRSGARNSYTVKITNPNPVAVGLRRLSICLPASFTPAGRPMGAIKVAGKRSACGPGRVQLTWAVKLAIAGGKSQVVRIPMRVAGPPRTARVTITGSAAAGFTTIAPKPTAPITVSGS
jgi:Bacterial Ig domain/Calx-beta domain